MCSLSASTDYDPGPRLQQPITAKAVKYSESVVPLPPLFRTMSLSGLRQRYTIAIKSRSVSAAYFTTLVFETRYCASKVIDIFLLLK